MRRLGRLRLVAYLAPVAVGLPLLAACTSILGSFEVGDVNTTDSGTCPANFVLKDGQCVSTATSCTAADAPKCGANGKCVDNPLPVKCACNPGYAGPTCGECAQGFQDNDKNGTCEPNCATANLACPQRAACSDTTGKAACNCALGYRLETPPAPDGGLPDAGAVDASVDASSDAAVEAGPTGPQCVWRGGPADPTFEKKPDAWRVVNGIADAGADASPEAGPAVIVDPTATGLTDPGIAKFTRNMCGGPTSRPGVTQVFDMPTPAESEPFALRVGGRSDVIDNRIPQLPRPRSVSLQIDIGKTKNFVSLGTPPGSERRYCLGEVAYGRGVNLGAFISSTSICSTFLIGDAFVDHISIVPDKTCPAVGQLLNGSFDTTDDWTASGTTAEFANVGTNGSRAARFASTTYCQSASVSGGKLSTPLTTPANLAVAVAYRGPFNRPFRINMYSAGGDGGQLAEMRSNGGALATINMCVPEYLKGQAGTLSLEMPYENPQNNCALADNREFVVDDLRFVNDPACPNPAYVINGGLETTVNLGPWNLYDSPFQASSAIIGSGGGAAHTGQRFVQLTSNNYCYGASANTTVTIPPANGAAGPAVKFWYRTTGTTGAWYSSYLGSLAASQSWTEKLACLPPTSIGRAAGISFQVDSSVGGTTCGQAIGQNQLFIDDVTVTTDASCPAQ